jgi:hypothetical protein
MSVGEKAIRERRAKGNFFIMWVCNLGVRQGEEVWKSDIFKEMRRASGSVGVERQGTYLAAEIRKGKPLTPKLPLARAWKTLKSAGKKGGRSRLVKEKMGNCSLHEMKVPAI